MKTNIYLGALLAIAVFTTACQQERGKAFIPGTYVNHAKGTYALADDTLVIRLSEGQNYEVLRRTGFNRILNGKLKKREHETETWRAVYDEKTGVLKETRYGKVITFYPDSVKLRVGNREYNKLK